MCILTQSNASRLDYLAQHFYLNGRFRQFNFLTPTIPTDCDISFSKYAKNKLSAYFLFTTHVVSRQLGSLI